jgi:hypothetical protein
VNDIDRGFLKVFVIVMGTPIFLAALVGWQQAGVVRQELRTSCGIDRTQSQVFWAGDQILELCKMKQQQLGVTINGKAPALD